MSEKLVAPDGSLHSQSTPPSASVETHNRRAGCLEAILNFLRIAWDFTESDFFTFVGPNSVFGIVGAFAAPRLLDAGVPPPSSVEILSRVPAVIAWNWWNLLVFDLANQRCPESVAEDTVNKPWRPVPSGRVTADQVRRAMLAVIPAVLGLNYMLGAWREGIFIVVLSWLYNDLRGGDDLMRDVIISFGYGCFNGGSLRLAVGNRAAMAIGPRAYTWTAVVSAVILTTMNIQDLKDQAGDRLRGRKTMPLWLGEDMARRALAFFIPFWSVVCPYFWRLEPWAYVLPWSLGIVVAGRLLLLRTQMADRRSWQMWCLWTVGIYLLPVL